jgi:hypothetical protein
MGRLTKEQQLELKGMLAYVNAVEPSFLVRLRRKYGSDVMHRIQSGSQRLESFGVATAAQGATLPHIGRHSR